MTKTTALEILSEPLSLLILLASLALEVLSPVFHYHQFGEASRMARDAMLSAIFIGGSLFAIFGAVRSFRREIESGTLEMVLAHPITRRDFFLAKMVGVFLAFLVLVVILGGVGVVMVIGAEVGGKIAEESGTVARVWGVSVLASALVIMLPLALGAFLNRFGRARFVRTVVFSSVVFSLLALIVLSSLVSWVSIMRLAPAIFLLVIWISIFLVAGTAMSVRFKAHIALSATFFLWLVLLPFVGNYYVAEMLSGGATLPPLFCCLAAGAAIPAIAAFTILGVLWANRRL